MPIKAIVSGVEKDIKRIPMKGRNMYAWPYTSSWGIDGTGQNRTVYNTVYTRSSVVKLKPNTQYTLSAKAAGSNDIYCRIAIFNESPKIGSVSTHYYYSSGDDSTTFTTGADEEWGIVVQNNAAAADTDLKRMLNEGSAPLPYEPYGYQEGWEVRDNQNRLIWGREETLTGTSSISFKGAGVPLKSVGIFGNTQQTGTPSPDNIITPEFCGVRTGNLLDYSTTQNGYTIDATTGLPVASPQRIATTTPIIIPESVSTVILTYASNCTFMYSIIRNGELFTRQTTKYSGTAISVNAGDALYLGWYKSGETLTKDEISDAMLNPGSTALPYEPYGYKIPITCAGQTVPVYLGQTQTLRRIKKLVLTGQETWGSEATNMYHVSCDMPLLGYSDAISDRYFLQASYAKVVNTDGAFGISRRPALFIHDDRYTSVNAWKAYLDAQYAAGTPVTVWYVLAEPETGIVNEPLAKIGDYADKLHSTVTIPTVKGQNLLTVDTTLPPSNTSITGHITSAS